jgi:hypothetical protein
MFDGEELVTIASALGYEAVKPALDFGVNAIRGHHTS